MKLTKEQIESMRNEDGNFSEPDVRAVEQITGMQWEELYKSTVEAEPEIKGNPAKWHRDKKLEFIEEYGREKYQQAVREYS